MGKQRQQRQRQRRELLLKERYLFGRAAIVVSPPPVSSLEVQKKLSYYLVSKFLCHLTLHCSIRHTLYIRESEDVISRIKIELEGEGRVFCVKLYYQSSSSSSSSSSDGEYNELSLGRVQRLFFKMNVKGANEIKYIAASLVEHYRQADNIELFFPKLKLVKDAAGEVSKELEKLRRLGGNSRFAMEFLQVLKPLLPSEYVKCIFCNFDEGSSGGSEVKLVGNEQLITRVRPRVEATVQVFRQNANDIAKLRSFNEVYNVRQQRRR